MLPTRSILLLENNEALIARFRRVIRELDAGFELTVWQSASAMAAECEPHFPHAAMVALGDTPVAPTGKGTDTGTDTEPDIATFLGDFLPVCPVLIHASDADSASSTLVELDRAGWKADRVSPSQPEWVETAWAHRARELIDSHATTWNLTLPTDHAARIERMLRSLNGLGVGDSLGLMLCWEPHAAPGRLASGALPKAPWFHTDDTEMAIAIAAVLKSYGEVNQEALARRFARRFERDEHRGYGHMTRTQLRDINAGAKWQDTAANAFSGQGSMGNGGAMRAAPLGAYFADDLERCVREAQASAVVTHTHPEGVAGTIAVAGAAAMAWRLRKTGGPRRARHFFEAVLDLTPPSEVREGIAQASELPADTLVDAVAAKVGNGALVLAQDTVPFCLWIAAHHPQNFLTSMAQTIRAGGDCDTNAAIVGGIVALSAADDAIPPQWLAARERFWI
jgi:ADP-ribosylglycohydrolase